MSRATVTVERDGVGRERAEVKLRYDGDAATLQVRIVPPRGEQWSDAGINRYARTALALAHGLAARIALEAPLAVMPSVSQGDCWTSGTNASVTVDTNGDVILRAYLQELSGAPLPKLLGVQP